MSGLLLRLHLAKGLASIYFERLPFTQLQTSRQPFKFIDSDYTTEHASTMCMRIVCYVCSMYVDKVFLIFVRAMVKVNYGFRYYYLAM